MKRFKKGEAGYIRYEKRKRAVITLALFGIALGVYAVGIAINGTRNNLLTVGSILGVLPAAKFMVDWIMMMMQKETPPGIVRQTEQEASNLTRGYELVVTAYEGRMPLDAVVTANKSAACLSLRGGKDLIPLMESHIAKILADNQCGKIQVKIFTQEKPFYDRLRQMGTGGSEIPEEETAKNERILQVIKAISL